MVKIMNGVEILTSMEVIVANAFNWKVFWITAGAIFGVFIIVGILVSVTDYDWFALAIFSGIGLIASLFFGILFGDVESIPTEYETHYKVTISDEVLMSEFSEKYEIVDQDGKIYTIRERD